MMIIGCDLHTRYQQVALLDTSTGEMLESLLEHENGEARAFYQALAGPVRVGIEATGHTHWFEAMLAEMEHELWMGDAAKMRAMVVRKQKTDARDAAHLLELLREGRFPKIWRPSSEDRDLRQLPGGPGFAFDLLDHPETGAPPFVLKGGSDTLRTMSSKYLRS